MLSSLPYSADVKLGTWIMCFFNIGVLAMPCDVALTANKTNQSTTKQTSKINRNKTSKIQPAPNLVLRPKSLLSLQVNIYNLGVIFCSASLIDISKSNFLPSSFYFFFIYQSSYRLSSYFSLPKTFKIRYTGIKF